MNCSCEKRSQNNLVPRVLSLPREKYFLEVERGPWERGWSQKRLSDDVTAAILGFPSGFKPLFECQCILPRKTNEGHSSEKCNTIRHTVLIKFRNLQKNDKTK